MGWGGQYAQPKLPSRAQRKSLRERWLMDGAAEGPEQQEDPQSPEGQAQARIRNLEDSLFT